MADDITSTRTTSDPPELKLERHLGPYQLVKELGHGGMGTVYLALRTDGSFQRRVAIKVIRGLDSDEVVRHFRRERRILASLDHPNIAKFLDGGSTEDGLPYFVMEYIEGQPIDGYCDAGCLDATKRIELFRTICAAVQYAHRNLIVHRDLKPANILVTPEGVVKLLDFGIAKLLNPELLGEAGTAGVIAFTPEYASPEQARGEPVTTSTDVYSLGVVLYELLTGRRPYRLKSRHALDVLKAVAEDEPERPSTAAVRVEGSAGDIETPLRGSAATIARRRDTSSDRLVRRLRGDLDSIALMALRKEPQKRYLSVEAFSEDLRAHLDGRPVLARKGTVGYRAVKFVRRHLASVVTGAAVVILSLTFALAMGVQSSRTRQALAQAEREKVRAQRVSSFLIDLFRISKPSEARGNTITAREVLDRGSDRIATDLKDEPGVRAGLLDTMGEVYSSLGLYDKASLLLREALELRRKTPGPTLEQADSLTKLGTFLYAKGDFAGSTASHAEALAIRRSLLGNDNVEVAKSLGRLSGALLYSKASQTEYVKAAALSREALAINRRILSPDDPLLADSMQDLATALRWMGSLSEAEALVGEGLALQRRIYGRDHPAISAGLNNLAIIRRDKGDTAGAEALLRESLEIKRRLLGNEHPQVGLAIHNLATVVNDGGNAAAAESLYREAIRIEIKAMGEDDPRVGSALSGLADALFNQGRLEEAEPLYRQALSILNRTLPARHRTIASALIRLGELLTQQGKPSAAEPMLREALTARLAALAPGDPEIADAQSALAECLTELRRLDEAERLLLESYPLLKRKLGDENRLTVAARRRTVKLYGIWKRPDRLAWALETASPR